MPTIFAIQGAPGTTDNDNGAHAFGNDFKANAAGTIDAVWYYHTSSGEPNSVTAQVHRQSNQAQLALKTSATAGFTDNAWNRIALDTPVAYNTPDELITISAFWPVGAGGGFVYTTGASETSSNGLTAAVGGTGRFKNAAAVLGDYPNQTFANLACPVGMEFTFSGGTVSGTAVIALGGLSASAVGQRTVLGVVGAALGGVSAAATGTRTVFGRAVANLGRLSAAALQEGAVLVADDAGGGWYGLLAIEQEARDLLAQQRSMTPVAGPVCGEPLRTGPNGQLYCPFDFCVGRGWS